MSVVGKMMRFEILKRDGFRCVYCGANAVATLLEVDHVVPSSRGGTDDPSNLVTACKGCNVGKSNVRLDETQISAVTAEALLEHAEQIESYLQAAKQLEQQKQSVCEFLFEMWCDASGEDGMPRSLWNDLRSQSAKHGIDAVSEAVRATGAKRVREKWFSDVDALRYFRGCLRRLEQ